MNDEIFMREALRIAKNAEGRTSPNPMVGAVIVKDGKIIAEGWHRQAGTPHAEIHALNMAGELAKGATLYVTLEPCSHFGRTPPCVNKIIELGIKKVVAAMKDPNPKVAGRGFEILKNAGIEVEIGLLEAESRKLNEVFLKFITKKLPFVTMKFASSLDGKIATFSGESQWISCEESRKFVHHLRDINDAILIGVGTVLADNPSLTTRLVEGKNPIRVIVDSNLRTPLDSKVVTDKSAKTIIATTKNAPNEKISALKARDVEILTCGDKKQVDLRILMEKLAEREITSILVEGGGKIHFSMLKSGLVDKIYAFIAPKIIGGANSLTPVEGIGFEKLSEAITLENFNSERIGEDFLLSGYVKEDFPCDKCGLCCKNIRFSTLSADLDRGDGVCKHLKNNLCEIYSQRPIFCNVDAYYEKFLTKTISREEFYKQNLEVCRRLKKLTASRKSDILFAKLGAECKSPPAVTVREL